MFLVDLLFFKGKDKHATHLGALVEALPREVRPRSCRVGLAQESSHLPALLAADNAHQLSKNCGLVTLSY